tara:strand:- start:297 stop:644 length:348 start_codon:yes stop_codon:yes gene_type:complete
MKDQIKIVEERWDTFSIFNAQGDATLVFDVTFELQLIAGEPEVRYLSNGDPGYPATASQIELLGVEIHAANIAGVMDNVDEIDLTPASKKALEVMLFAYAENNLHSIEWKQWEGF